MIVIVSASQKGGVTKTSHALAGASLLAQRHRVAIVDLDPEAYATTLGLGQPKAADPLREEPRRIQHSRLANGELWLFAGGDAVDMASEAAIRAHIARASGVGDIVVIDTPPNGRSAAVAAALRTASVVVAPVIPEFQSLLGLQRLMATARLLGSQAPIRALLSRWEVRTVLAQDVHQQLVAAHPGLALSSIVPRDQRAAEAMAAGCPLPFYAKRSAAAAAYRTATYEIAALAGLHLPQGVL